MKLTRFRVDIILMLFASLAQAASQYVGKADVSGRVTDNDNSAVVGANVFINNSTLGSSTGESGSFIIRNVPYGSYELVVSHINYNTRRLLLTVASREETQISINLARRVIALPEINVVSEYPQKWHDNLQRFLPLLLGTTEFAEQCSVQNPEVLDFQDDGASFRANASQPVKIRNPALGYVVSVEIDTFSLDGRWLSAGWDAKFEPMESSEADELAHWEANRAKAYNSSYRHFLISLIRGKLAENKIRIFQVPTPRRKTETFTRFELSANDILVERSDHWILNFEDYLEVECASQTIHVGYDTKLRVHRKRPKVSWLRLENGPVLISNNGFAFPRFGIRVLGDWAGERVANIVPVNIEGQPAR